METLKRKMKFLATKLAALQSEVAVSREIFQAASAEVEKMFNKKYFPEVPVESDQKDTDMEEYSEEEADKREKSKKKKKDKNKYPKKR